MSKIRQLHCDATKVAESRYNEQPFLEDDMLSFREDIDLFYDNMKEYRAHIAHKVSEGNFDKKFYLSLDETEVVVICDWKMKILASKHREAQQGKIML